MLRPHRPSPGWRAAPTRVTPMTDDFAPGASRQPRDDETLADALRGLYDATFDWNLETNEVSYSAGWKRMLGYDADDLAPTLDTWSNLCHDEDREQTLRLIESCFAEGRDRFETEFRLRHADGHWCHILSRGSLVRDAAGQPVSPRRVIGTHVDLSSHAAAEWRLEQSLSLLRATFDSTADGLLVADGQGRMVNYNHRFVELWRLPPELAARGDDQAALAFVLDQLVDPAGFRAKVDDLYSHPEAESFDVLRFKDGRVFERYSRPLRAGGQTSGRVWSFRDVTERERAIANLAEEVGRRRVLFDQSRDGIVVIGMDGGVRDCNRRFAQMLGCTVPEVMAMHVWDWDATMSAAEIRELFLTTPLDPHQFRTRHRRRDGSTFEAEISSGNLVWDGQPQYLCTVRDITERMRDEQEREQLREQLLQAQKMDAIGQLTGGIAHEFNNMLSVVLGYSSLAGEIAAGRGDDTLAGYLASMRRAAENARDLVAKLLAFGRRRPVAQRVPQDAVTLTESALRLLRPTLPASLRISADLPVAAPAVAIDPVEYQQVVANLLLNAGQATDQQGQVTVRLDEREVSALCAGCRRPFSGRYVTLTVADDGAGMTPEVQSRVFEPFFTTKEVGSGTGLGLSVVHGIVHTAGGHLLVESAPGQGTTFTMLLPVAGAAPAPLPAAAADRPGTGSAVRRLLVVDDQPEVADLLAEMLISRGHRARVCYDGASALAVFRAAPEDWDAVISDQTMPEMSGRELLLAVRALRPEVPLVIWTGFSAALDEAKAAELGFSAYLRKPVTMDELETLLHRLF
jgi:PAS domain S-box-containing protein